MEQFSNIREAVKHCKMKSKKGFLGSGAILIVIGMLVLISFLAGYLLGVGK